MERKDNNALRSDSPGVTGGTFTRGAADGWWKKALVRMSEWKKKKKKQEKERRRRTTNHAKKNNFEGIRLWYDVFFLFVVLFPISQVYYCFLCKADLMHTVHGLPVNPPLAIMTAACCQGRLGIHSHSRAVIHIKTSRDIRGRVLIEVPPCATLPPGLSCSPSVSRLIPSSHWCFSLKN